MSSSVLHSIIFFFFFFLIILDITIFCLAADNNYSGSDCLVRERKALLRLKASLSDPSNRLSSWNNSTDNCCTWTGVHCDEATGHVIGLHLRNQVKDDEQVYPSSHHMLYTETLDSSLLELKHLSYLDLSWNYFEGSQIPAFLGSMKQLQYLNLSNAGFGGVIPHQLGNLVNLRTLDIGCSYEYQYLRADDLNWARNLSLLEYLDLSYVNLRMTKDHLFEVLSVLPSLVGLRLSHSGLDNTYISHINCMSSTPFTNIRFLDLSRNLFEGDFPCFLHNITSLHFLDLSQNQYYNSFDPRFLPSTNLEHLNLAFNSLNKTIDWIISFLSDKCRLRSLSLRHNDIHGDMSILFRNLSTCWSQNMETLDLGDNELYGQLPMEFGELKQLEEIDLSGNKLSGPLPSSLQNLRALRVIRVGGNSLSGAVPISLGQMSNLDTIDLYRNAFEGLLSDAHFMKLSKLKWLGLGFNSLTLRVGYQWVPPFQLKYLDMESIELEGRFPEWLQTQKALNILNLHNCSMKGTLPGWLHSLKNLTFFEVSSNHIEGPIPKLPSSIIWLDLSDNMMTDNLASNIGHMIPRLLRLNLARNSFNGTIPVSVCQMKSLHDIDLSENSLSGHLPECLLGSLPSLWIALFSSNQLTGLVPNSIGGAYSLEWLHLNNNSLTGQLPPSLKNCSDLISLDVGDNKLSGLLPEWIGDKLLNLAILRLRNNGFSGNIPSSYCQLDRLQIMDLANNNLTGNIPRGFGNFSGMVLGDATLVNISTHMLDGLRYRFSEVLKGVMREYIGNSRYLVNLDLSSNQLAGEICSELMNLNGLKGFNLSHNHLTGQVPIQIGDMISLESLDLSNNYLVGTIPESLSKLTFLSHLNLSNNNLSGRIPSGRQLQTLKDSLNYEGNPGLCGAPLMKQCEINGTLPKDGNGKESDDDEINKLYLYAFIVSGFATGFWGYFGVLVFKRSWRLALFGWMEAVLHKMMRRLQMR